MPSLPTRSFLGLSAIGVCAVVTMTITGSQTPKRRPVQELLPASTVVFFSHDGSAKHEEAWKETAAFEALYESGMMDFVQKILEFVAQQTGQNDNPRLWAAIKQVGERGMSLAISISEVGPSIPRLTLVIHDAAGLEQEFGEVATNYFRVLGLKFDKKTIQGRTIHSAIVPQSPGIEVSYWAEGQHLVVHAGIGAVAEAIAVADGNAPHLATNSVWNKYRFETSALEATSVVWVDLTALRTKFGEQPLPQPARGTVHDVLRALGLHNLDAVAWQYGYKGRAMWTEGHLEVDGKRTGLLGIADQRPLTLQDLPPLPRNVNGFSATRIDPSKLWITLTSVARDVAALGPPEAVGEVDRLLDEMRQAIGFDPKVELLDPLGDIICVFTDPDQGFLGSGLGVAFQVDDADKLRTAIEKLIARANEATNGQFSVRRIRRHGREIVLFQAAKQTQVGALTVDKDWMVIGLMPQTLEAFVLRVDGKLPAWQPTEQQAAALAELPSQFQSISVGDPRIAWQSLMKLAPPAMVAAETVLKENGTIPRDAVIPVTAADIPPAELVVQPLFPNVSVSVVDEDGIHMTTRRSMPGIPLVGGIGEGSSAATVAVGVALLLPAVQSARQAARRTQSMNHLKQLALGAHNYHDAYASFPPGTHPNEKLKPHDRFSWLARILPFVEQSPLYDRLDFEEAWDDEVNKDWVVTRVTTFLNPGYPDGGDGAAPTHYAGMAGVGADAPSLAVTHSRAGIFGDNRTTRIRDITDGTSNTIMITEVSDKFGAWAQGGHASYRSLTKKPYINGPDGIGGPFRGGCNMAFADGSVRFISENVDPSVLEALSTIAGREIVPNF